MFILFALFGLLCLYKVQLKPASGENYITDYMSIDKTNAIKGIFIAIVFFSHFNGYVEFTNAYDEKYAYLMSEFGQRMVTLFLFYSGYGVMESIKKKGMPYIHKIPKTRVLATYFRFDIALLFYFALKFMANIHYHISPKHLALTIIGWDSIGNSNWYIFVIIVLYVFTFIAFEIFRDKLNYIPSVILVTFITFVYVSLHLYFAIKYPHGVIHDHGSRWYNTAICYPLGMIYSVMKPWLDKIINKHIAIWTLLLAGLVAVEIASYNIYDDISNKYIRFADYSVEVVAFVGITVLFTMHASLNNFVLRFLGKHLFGIYIMMRVPMIFFSSFINISEHIYIYFFVCLVCTIPLAYMLDTFTDKAWKRLIQSKKVKEAK